LASTSDQIRWRRSESASITTTGWFGSKLRATSEIGTAPVASNAFWLSSPGTCVTISCPGLKPSFMLYGPGSIGFCATLRGMSANRKSMRSPVGVEGSAFVK